MRYLLHIGKAGIHMLFSFLILILGFLFLIKGADWFVEGASGIARFLGIPQLVIGLTIVAMGTSLPEAAVSITAASQNNAAISIGNVVGSNILNILIILGVTSVITDLSVQKSTVHYEIPFMIGISILLFVFGLTDHSISFAEGIIFWILFLCYLGYLAIMARKNKETETCEKNIPLWKCILMIMIGCLLIIKGSDFAVSGASDIARYFGISEHFIGLTIVALGTSLPELVTSVTAALHKNADIAIGNIVGSNIFNILFILGTTSFFCTIPFEPRFLIDTAVAIGSALLLWLSVYRRNSLQRPAGILMLICYVIYFIYLCMA